MAWHGCSRSESALMTGTVAQRASSSSVLWAKTRAAMPSTHRERLRAMSGTDSRLPGPMSWAERYTAAPPSWTMRDLEGDARPQRGLLEDERERAAGERSDPLARLQLGLELGRQLEDVEHVLPVEVADRQEVVHGATALSAASMMPQASATSFSVTMRAGASAQRVVPGREHEQPPLAAGGHHVAHRRHQVEADEETAAADLLHGLRVLGTDRLGAPRS